MFIEFDRKRGGHVLILTRGEEINKRCCVCGKEINPPFFICETRKQLFCRECNTGKDCIIPSFKEDHVHFNIVEVIEG